MALPKIVQKLFSDEGKGSKLRPDIVPTTINGNSPDPEGNFTPKQTGCLPLSGGTVTGIIKTSVGDFIQKTTDDHFLSLFGGSTRTSGAQLILSGKDRTDNSGRFSLYARNSTGEAGLVGSPEGALSWKGNSVITSAGGTITGAVKFSLNDVIGRSVDNKWLTIFGGTTAESSYLQLYGKSYTNTGFILSAKDGTNTSTLVGMPTGTLTWKSKNIVRSVNGTTADANGNVTISVPTTPKAYVTETWRSGTEWYRKYSDGWIEQGGICNRADGVVTFPTAFQTKCYGILDGRYLGSNQVANFGTAPGAYSITKTGFKFSDVEGPVSYPIYWRAEGY